jgi:hypothetical protein
LDYHLELRQEKGYDVLALHSAPSFKPQWCQYLLGYEDIWLCLDNDDAGRQGVRKVADVCKQTMPELTRPSMWSLSWPPRFPDKYDIADLIRDDGDFDIRRFFVDNQRRAL